MINFSTTGPSTVSAPTGVSWGDTWTQSSIARKEALGELRRHVTSLQEKKEGLARQMEQLDTQLAGLPRSGQVSTEAGQSAQELKQEQAELKKNVAALEQRLKTMPKQLAMREIALQAAERAYAAYDRNMPRAEGHDVKTAGADATPGEAASALGRSAAGSSRPESGMALRRRLMQELTEKKSEFDASVKQGFEQSDTDFDESFPGIRQHPECVPYHLKFARAAQGLKRVGEGEWRKEKMFVLAGGVAYDTTVMLMAKNVFERAWVEEWAFDKRAMVAASIWLGSGLMAGYFLRSFTDFAMLASNEYPLQQADIAERIRDHRQESAETLFETAEQRWHELNTGGDKGKMFDMVQSDVGLAQALIVYANILAPAETSNFIHALRTEAWGGIEKAIRTAGTGGGKDADLLDLGKLEKRIGAFVDSLVKESNRKPAKESNKKAKRKQKKPPASDADAIKDLVRFLNDHPGKVAQGVKKLLTRFSVDFMNSQEALMQELKAASGREEPVAQAQSGSATAWSFNNLSRVTGMRALRPRGDIEAAKKAAREDLDKRRAEYNQAQKELDEIDDRLPALRRRIAEINASLTQARAIGAAQRERMQEEKNKAAQDLRNLETQSLDWLTNNPHARSLIDRWALDRVINRHTLAADDDSNPKKLADRLPFPKERQSRNDYETYFLSGLKLLEAILIAHDELGPKDGKSGAVAVPFKDRYLNCGQIVGTAYRREAGDRLDTSGIQVSMNENHVITHLHPYAPRIWETAD